MAATSSTTLKELHAALSSVQKKLKSRHRHLHPDLVSLERRLLFRKCEIEDGGIRPRFVLDRLAALDFHVDAHVHRQRRDRNHARSAVWSAETEHRLGRLALALDLDSLQLIDNDNDTDTDDTDIVALRNTAIVKAALCAASPVFWSFCENKLVDAVSTWHCLPCVQCRPSTHFHCEECDTCVKGPPPCSTCKLNKGDAVDSLTSTTSSSHAHSSRKRK
ncbi:hypothetical protein BCR33DRAFT_850767 [Rhizoclosmatium globosum]|uniref:Uncharacterized protein n=1 Tax=Rhizoclosmatium globosum TaxID=329046 RepID=A0A1Y2CBC2_9FUNG|nr:hypothetical protein BCR33DRAFT_850767 [Rhizoclosmatium globosum]|eukprot:ORY44144.1 hypothetical protein BCR33DRAFT_850767 [Rhizoclosmatium globosum]